MGVSYDVRNTRRIRPDPLRNLTTFKEDLSMMLRMLSFLGVLAGSLYALFFLGGFVLRDRIIFHPPLPLWAVFWKKVQLVMMELLR